MKRRILKKSLKVPRSKVGSITEEIWNCSKCLSRPEIWKKKKKWGCQRDNHRNHQDFMWERSELKLLLRKRHITAWLQFAKQHLNEPENMKERFCLMRQGINSLTWILIAISNESYTLLINIPVGTHGASTSFHIFWGCFWAAGTEKLSEKIHTSEGL